MSVGNTSRAEYENALLILLRNAIAGCRCRGGGLGQGFVDGSHCRNVFVCRYFVERFHLYLGKASPRTDRAEADKVLCAGMCWD